MSDHQWPVQITFTEEDQRTRADAILELAERRFHGFGQAKRAPEDPNVPVVGQELAAARALSNLSHQLLDEASPWKATVPIEEGLARALQWYRDNGWLPAAGVVAKTLAGAGQGVRPG